MTEDQLREIERAAKSREYGVAVAHGTILDLITEVRRLQEALVLLREWRHNEIGEHHPHLEPFRKRVDELLDKE